MITTRTQVSRNAVRIAILGLLAALLLVPGVRPAEAAEGDPGTISGVVTGGGGPIQFAQITAYVYDAEFDYWGYVNDTSTDELGHYDLSLDPGEYRLEFAGEGFVTEFYDNAETVDEGASVEVVSDAATSISVDLEQEGVIAGTITGPEGAVENAEVTAMVQGQGGEWEYAGYSSTSSTGAYEITRLRAGTYIVRVAGPEDSGLVDEYHHDAMSESDATQVSVTAGETTTVDEALSVGSTISGRVTDSASAAVSAGTVVVYAWDEAWGYWDYLDSDSTDEAGNYSITGLAPGTYRVGFSADGFIDEFHLNAFDLDAADDVSVPAGATVTIDAQLARGGTISGMVDGPSGPLDDADVTLYRLVGGAWDSVPSLSTTTGGAYSFTGLQPGTYTVRFEATGMATEFHNNVYDLQEATGVNIVGEGTQTINATLGKAPKINGTLSNTTDAIAGGYIEAERLVTNEDGRRTFNYYDDEITDEAGQYSLDVAPGTYRLWFSARGHRDEYYDNAATASRATRIVVVDADKTANATLTRLGRINGTVTSGGAPVADVEVTLFESDGEFDHMNRETAITNELGQYSFSSLIAGHYRLGFSGDGYVTEFSGDSPDVETAEDVTVADDNTTTVDAQLATMQPTIGGVVTKAGATGIEDATVVVERKVVADDETTYREVAEVDTEANGSWSTAVRPGTYVVSFEAEGYLDEYWDGAFVAKRATEVVVTGDRNDINAELEAVSAEHGALSGIVSDADGPLEFDAWVTAYRETGVPGVYEWYDQESAGEEGAYAFAALPPGNYKVLFSADGHKSEYYDDQPSLDAAAVVPITVGGTSTANAVLEKSAGLSGRVTLPGGAHVDGWITVYERYEEDGDFFWDYRGDVETNADGTWHLGVGEGTYRVSADVFGFAREWNGDAVVREEAADIVVGESDVAGVDFALTAGGTIDGTITQRPRDEVEVALYYFTGGHWRHVDLDYASSDGSYAFEHVKPGTYRLGFSGQGVQAQYSDGTPGGAATIEEATDVVVTEGGTVTRDATMTRGGTISGTITGANGAPIEDAVVNVYREEGGSYEFVTNGYPDADGDYVVSVLPGNYKVLFRSAGDDNRLQTWFGGNDEPSADVIPVAMADVPGIDGVLQDAGTVTGRVSFPTRERGWATDVVLLHKATGDYAGSARVDATNNTFSIQDLAPGTYRAEFARASGYSVAEAQFFNAKPESAGSASAADITVTQGGVVSGVDAVLAKGGTLKGTIKDGEGNPLEGCTISAFTADGQLVARDSLDSDELGNYRVPGLSQGNYLIEARFGDCGDAASYFDGAGPMSGTRSTATTLAVSRTGTVTQDLVISDEPRVTATEGPEIIGQAKVGETLTAVAGTWDPADATLTYQWLRAGTEIPDATDLTYDVQAADLGKVLTFRVTATKTGLQPGEATVSTSAVTAGSLVKGADPAIEGSAAVGSELTASAGSWTPAPTGTSYQWLADGATIAGATSATYTPIGGDVGKKLSVRVTVTRAGYANGVATSAQTGAVQNAAFVKNANPTVVGTPQVGVALGSTAGSWTPTPTTTTYQWLANGAVIAGATSANYTPVEADRGKKLSVRVTVSKSGFADATATSAQTAAVPGVEVPIAGTAAPSISGDAKVGGTLSTDGGAWTPAGVTLAYQWLRGGVPIAGTAAQRSSYTLVAADRGKLVSVRVTATLAGHEGATQTSAARSIGYGTISCTRPTRTGRWKVGARMRATQRCTTSGTVARYQWYRNGVKIKRATGATYKVKRADRRKRISVRVIRSKSGYARLVMVSAKSRKVK